MEIEDVSFSGNNIKLSGKLYTNTDSVNKSVVVLSHDLGGKKEWLEKKAMAICKSGNHVFTFDFRGHGKSNGTANYETIYDLYTAIDYVHSLFSLEIPVILGGQCMGGLFSFHAATKCKNIIGVFGMSITPEWVMSPEIWSLTVQNMEAHKGGHNVRMDNESLRQFFLEHDVREAIKKLPGVPILLVHFEKDEISPVESLINTFLHSCCEKNIFIFNQGQHTSPYLYNNINDILIWWINQKKERWYST